MITIVQGVRMAPRMWAYLDPPSNQLRTGDMHPQIYTLRSRDDTMIPLHEYPLLRWDASL